MNLVLMIIAAALALVIVAGIAYAIWRETHRK